MMKLSRVGTSAGIALVTAVVVAVIASQGSSVEPRASAAVASPSPFEGATGYRIFDDPRGGQLSEPAQRMMQGLASGAPDVTVKVDPATARAYRRPDGSEIAVARGEADFCIAVHESDGTRGMDCGALAKLSTDGAKPLVSVTAADKSHWRVTVVVPDSIVSVEADSQALAVSDNVATGLVNELPSMVSVTDDKGVVRTTDESRLRDLLNIGPK